MTYQPEIPGLSHSDALALDYLHAAREHEIDEVSRRAQTAYITSMQDKAWGDFKTGPVAESQAVWDKIIGRLAVRPCESYTVDEKTHGYTFAELGGLQWTFGRLWRPDDAGNTIAIDTTISAPIQKKHRYVINAALSFQNPETGRIKNRFNRTTLRGSEYEVPRYNPLQRQRAKREFARAFITKFLAGRTSLQVDVQYTSLGSTAAPKNNAFTITNPSVTRRPATLNYGNALLAYAKYCKKHDGQFDASDFMEWMRARSGKKIITNLENIMTTMAEIDRTESID